MVLSADEEVCVALVNGSSDPAEVKKSLPSVWSLSSTLHLDRMRHFSHTNTN